MGDPFGLSNSISPTIAGMSIFLKRTRVVPALTLRRAFIKVFWSTLHISLGKALMHFGGSYRRSRSAAQKLHSQSQGFREV